MSAIANILGTQISAAEIRVYSADNAVATDATFSPEGPLGPGVNSWVNRAGGQAINYPRYNISIRRPVGNSRNFRIKETISLPVPNITSPSTATGIQPVPSKAFEMIATREYVIPEAAALADRKAFFALCATFMSDTIYALDGSPNAVSGAPLKAAIETLEQPY